MTIRLLITRKKERHSDKSGKRKKTRRIKRYLSRKQNNKFQVKRLSVRKSQFGGKDEGILKKIRSSSFNYKYVGEFEAHGFKELNSRVKEGKNYLNKLLNTNINSFVPPSNMISTEGIKAVYENNLNLSGIIGAKFNRDISIKSLTSYTKRLYYKLYLKKIYPYALKYKKHNELVAYALTPTTDQANLRKIIDYCIKKQAPFQLCVHYWELKGELLKDFYEIINYLESKNYKPITLNNYFKTLS